jgi:hypothetical protein
MGRWVKTWFEGLPKQLVFLFRMPELAMTSAAMIPTRIHVTLMIGLTGKII